MTTHDIRQYIAYLKAKKNVDDRALNRHVWQTLKAALPPTSGGKPIRSVELGAGIGTMLERIGRWGLMKHFDYTMVDINPEYLHAFRSFMQEASSISGFALTWQDHNQAHVSFQQAEGSVETVCADLHEYLTDSSNRRRFQLVMAHAVMDLVDMNPVLAGFERIALPGGLIYLSLNYDGWTCFLPPVDPVFEKAIMERYHRSMDQRTVGGRQAGASRAGRMLFDGLNRKKMPILAAGSSDWIVHPRKERYAEEDAFFLQMIVQTIHRQLQADAEIDQQRLSDWVNVRNAQLESGRLILIARNIDFLATTAR